MRLIIGEDVWDRIERLAFRGGIGLYYDSTIGGIITYLVVGLLCIFACIGCIVVLKWLFFGHPKKEKEDPGKKWLRTGKF